MIFPVVLCPLPKASLPGLSWLVKLDDKDDGPAGSPCLSFLADVSALGAPGRCFPAHDVGESSY